MGRIERLGDVHQPGLVRPASSVDFTVLLSHVNDAYTFILLVGNNCGTGRRKVIADVHFEHFVVADNRNPEPIAFTFKMIY